LDFHHPQAWHLCDPNAGEVFKALRKSGVKLAIVSNFDTRLRPLLRALNCDDWFDAVAVSAEVCKLFFFFLSFLHFVLSVCVTTFSPLLPSSIDAYNLLIEVNHNESIITAKISLGQK
jgi:hypothetical protein